METNLYDLSPRRARRPRHRAVPETLGEAIEELAASALMRKALGDHIFQRYVELKRREWEEYRVQLPVGAAALSALAVEGVPCDNPGEARSVGGKASPRKRLV